MRRRSVAVVVTLVSMGASAEPAVTRDRASDRIVRVSGLSTRDGCAFATGLGRVRSVTLERGSLRGFRFVDRQYGESYVNVGVQDAAMAPALKGELKTWLKEIIKPGAELKLGILGCGAAGRVEVLDAVEPAALQKSLGPGEATSRSASVTPTPSAAAGQWVYGHHPTLGRSAHITVASETFGLACGFAGADLARRDTVSVRITPGVSASAAKPGGVLVFYDGSGGNVLFQTAGVYLENRENACDTLKNAQSARRLIFAEGRLISLESKGTAPITTVTIIEQRGVTKTIRGDGDLGLLVDTREFPLTGSGRAIRQLIAACPAISADLRNDCGV